MHIDKTVEHTEKSLNEINNAVGEFREQRYLYSIIEGRISAAELHLLEIEIDRYIGKEEAECIRLELFAEEFNNNYASNYADLPKRVDYIFGKCLRSTLYDLKKIFLQLCPRKQRRRRSDGSTLHKSVFEHSLASQLMPYMPDLFGLESFPPDKQRLLGKLGVFHCLAKRIISIAWELIREENRILLNDTEVAAIFHQHVARIRKELEGLSQMLQQPEDAMRNPLYESSQKDPEHFISANFHKHDLGTFREFVAIKKCQEDLSHSNPFTSTELEMLSGENQAGRLLTVICHFDTLHVACRTKKDCEHPVMKSEVLIQLMLWSGISDPGCIAPFAAMFARIYGADGHYLLPTQHSLRSQWNQLLRQERLVLSPDFARQLDELIEHNQQAGSSPRQTPRQAGWQTDPMTK